MRKSLLKLLLGVVAFGLSASVHALGMGGINVTSALGQPLRADIELVAVGKAEKSSLIAALASSDAYKDAGLEYPYGKFKFEVGTRSSGEPYLVVQSEQPINDPFVSLLVELTWPSGRLLREYTFLLDPPGYVPTTSVQPPVQVVAPSVAASPVETFVEPMDSILPAEQSDDLVTLEQKLQEAMPVDVTEVPVDEIYPVPVEVDMFEETPVAGSEVQDVETFEEQAEVSSTGTQEKVSTDAVEESKPIPVAELSPPAPETIVVPRGSTMYKLAKQYKSSDTSVERMLVAMYRANVDKFQGRNMNRIWAGKILKLPSEQEIAAIEQNDAAREIRVQAADWNAYRQKLASAAATSRPEVSEQVTAGKITSIVDDKAPVAQKSAKEVLRLSRGVPPDDKASVGGKGSSQASKDSAQEELISKAKAAQEQKMRVAMLEQNLKDVERLAQLKAEAAALAAKPSGSANKQDAESPADTQGKMKAETAVKPSKPPVKPKVKPKVTEEPSMIDQVLSEPLYLAGGAALLIVLGGLGFVLNRRKKKRDEWVSESGGDSSEDPGEITGHLTAPVIPSPDTGDFTRTVVTSAPAATQAQTNVSSSADHEPESVDPISEADLFLSFGRDAQAEEILTDALRTMPNNNQVRLKLLGIYSSRQDVDSFGSIAKQLKDSGDEYAWDQAVEMGRKIDPDNALYGGGGSSRSLEDTGSATVQMTAFEEARPSAPEIDLDLDTPKASEETSSAEQNFLGDMETTAILSSSPAEAEKDSGMDFDITSSNPSLTALDADSGGMDFDISGGLPEQNADGAVSAPESDLGMAFTLDFPVEKEEAVEKASEPSGDGLAGINLNFDETPSSIETSAESQGEQWQEVATKLDLAKAYQEMGDADGAREILDEVLREGDAEQRQAAQSLLDQLG